MELKGYLRTDARKKLELFKQQFPHIDLRLVFQNSKATYQGTKKKLVQNGQKSMDLSMQIKEYLPMV